jgi:hypothetical protein
MLLKKLEIEPPCDSAITLLIICPMQIKLLCWRAICNPMLIAALLAKATKWKQCKCPSTDEWIKNGTLSSHKNKIFLFTITWTKLEFIIFTEVSQHWKICTAWSHW